MQNFTENQIVEICSKSILLKNIKKEIIKDFFSSIDYRIIHVKKGELVIKEEDILDDLCIILQGKINVCKYYTNGGESILCELMPHELLGIDVLCTPTRESFYNAYAAEESYILKIKMENIDKDNLLTVDTKIVVYKNIITCLANKSAKKCRKIEIISQKNARDKIMNYLLIQQHNNKSNKFKISFDRDQLANFLCINRSVLSHELSLMQQEKIIRFKKNEFEIL